MQYAMTDAIFIFHFGLFFALNGPKNQKILENEKDLETSSRAYQKL